MKPNAAGYMYESFHNKARQPWDNNTHKAIPMRLSFSPIADLEIGGSFMVSQYTDEDSAADRFARYYFAHLLYGGERLTVAAEFGQLEIDVNPANMQTIVNGGNGTMGDTLVIQRSAYVSAGYKLLSEQWGVFSFEPVVRWEFMDSWEQDETNLGDRHCVWLGFRLSPTEGWVIKAAYLFQWEPDGPSLDNDGVVVEAVFEF